MPGAAPKDPTERWRSLQWALLAAITGACAASLPVAVALAAFQGILSPTETPGERLARWVALGIAALGTATGTAIVRRSPTGKTQRSTCAWQLVVACLALCAVGLFALTVVSVTGAR